MKAFAEFGRGSVVTVNLMQLRSTAVYESSLVDNCSGYEALAQCINDSATIVRAAGSELVYSGQALQMHIDANEKVGDLVALVRCPSASAYLAMIATEARGCSQIQNCRSFRL
jgi:hypothetical protein